MMWDLESRMRESYPTLFRSGNFRGQKFYKWGRVVIPRIQLIYLIEFSFFLYNFLGDLIYF